ncbi:MAG: hypothetical protein AB1847_07775 [bacterium]
MFKRVICQGIVFIVLACCGVFLLFPPSVGFAQNPEAQETDGLIQIKAENGLLSVNLVNAQLVQVLQEIARQTGVQFVGWENAQGLVTQQFDNVPLDEGLKRISQSFIMVLRKAGEEGKPLRVEKVIIIAQNDTPAAPLETEPEEKPAAVSIPSIPVVQPDSSNRPPAQVTPPPQKVEPPKEEVFRTPEAEKKQPPRDMARSEESSPPAAVVNAPETNVPEKIKSEGKKGRGKKTKPSAKVASLQSATNLDRTRGEEFFKQKRWDKVVTYFGRYLEQNPQDQEIQEKFETARKNAEQAISLYQQGKKLEDEENFEAAYECYKKTCDIYPLLYDAWERMNAIQRKVQK